MSLHNSTPTADFSAIFAELKDHVAAARDELDLAVALHETYQSTVQDIDLFNRLGVSQAGKTFNIIRLALRRETVLALMRLWDSHQDAIRLTLVNERLKNKNFLKQLIECRLLEDYPDYRERALKADAFRTDFRMKAAQIYFLIAHYSEGGVGFATRRHFQNLRNEIFAHRQLILSEAIQTYGSDDDFESFFKDMQNIVSLLIYIFFGNNYLFSEISDFYKENAKYFWASVRGEQTEGHPDYRAPPHMHSTSA